jgi:hypothetical protein
LWVRTPFMSRRIRYIMWSSLSATCDRSVVSSTNETDCQYTTEILLKVVLNTINLSSFRKCRVWGDTWKKRWESEGCLMPSEEFFSWREQYMRWDDDVHFVLDQHSDTLFWFWANQSALSPYCFLLIGEAANTCTNFLVFG